MKAKEARTITINNTVNNLPVLVLQRIRETASCGLNVAELQLTKDNVKTLKKLGYTVEKNRFGNFDVSW